jgi:predicted kinase
MGKKLIVLQGIPASGKSFWAKQYVLESPLTRVRINRDDIRNMLGKYWVTSREDLVTSIEFISVKEALSFDYDVVVDSTNLNKNSINRWKMLAEDENAEIEFKPFYISLEEAIIRDSKRDAPVGKQTVERFYNKYNNKF